MKFKFDKRRIPNRPLKGTRREKKAARTAERKKQRGYEEGTPEASSSRPRSDAQLNAPVAHLKANAHGGSVVSSNAAMTDHWPVVYGRFVLGYWREQRDNFYAHDAPWYPCAGILAGAAG